MKKKNTTLRIRSILSLVAFTLLAVFMSGCDKEEDDPISPVDEYGTVTFWNNQSAVGAIQVTVDGSTSDYITITAQATECDKTDCANFDLRKGSHSFTAESATGETWSGTFNLSSGCLLFQLH
jgi:hypothetical protein